MPQGYDPRDPRNRRENRNSRPDPNTRNRTRRPADQFAREPQRQGEPRRRRPQPMPAEEPKETYEEVDTGATIKGLIAVFMTTLIVIIIVMLFAKSLFVSSEELAKNLKTGQLTETEYLAIQEDPGLEEEVVTTDKKEKKKKTTTEEEKAKPAELPEGLDTSVAGTYMVNDAVYLHPTPDSASANLATLPYGTEIEVFGSSNYGWYYVEYEGQYGYAWGTYFTPKT